MNGKSLYRMVADGVVRPRAVAEACWEVACRDDVREAWEAVRPHDDRRLHALQTVHAVLRSDPSPVDPVHLRRLDRVLGESIDDLRRWSPAADRLVCDRAVASLAAARYAVRATYWALAGDPAQVAVSACACARNVAEAAIEPVDDLRADLAERASRSACEPEVEAWVSWMQGGC